jgi:hypothetical protein
VAVLIFASFICDMLETQLIPRAVDRKSLINDDVLKWRERFFDSVEIAFTVIFACELVWNMFVHWFWDFFSDGWCLFDCKFLFAVFLYHHW